MWRALHAPAWPSGHGCSWGARARACALLWLALGGLHARKGVRPALAGPGRVACPASGRASQHDAWQTAAAQRGGPPGTARALRSRGWSTFAAAGRHGYA